MILKKIRNEATAAAAAMEKPRKSHDCQGSRTMTLFLINLKSGLRNIHMRYLLNHEGKMAVQLKWK